ncbi:DNA primase [Candidatus Bathyarchaeota archaeon]|nr:DNA primase [Candidatus Bathyarchaeota archaeon]
MSDSQLTTTTKYVIYTKFEVNGVVEKPDVIGAIFGQTEGIFGPDLDLRELQKTGRIGRIEIEMTTKQGKTQGQIIIPSSLDRTSTSIIAAAIESVDRIGPYEAKATLEKIDDVRDVKRKAVIARAKEILQKWIMESVPSTDEVIREVFESLKPAEVISFGPEGLPAGPEIGSANSIIVVEGRADVINLLKCGFRNVIAIEGAKIPETIIKLCKDKEVTVFLDGDRGGDLILKELLQVADIDFIARAPQGKEVEELTPKEIFKALRDKVPLEQIREERIRYPRHVREVKRKLYMPKAVIDAVTELKGTLEAIILNEKTELLARLPVSELAEKLRHIDNAYFVIFDGVITQRLVDIASERGVKYIIADRISDVAKRPVHLRLLTFTDICSEEIQEEKNAKID